MRNINYKLKNNYVIFIYILFYINIGTSFYIAF